VTSGELLQLCGDCVWGSINGRGRGDGYDVEAYRLGQRYLVRVYDVQSCRSSWYTAPTLDDAKAVGRAGYSPGSAPGRYRYVSAPSRLPEIRAAVAAASEVQS